MTITLQAVNELIASLDSAGELSIREQKFLKLAKAFKQLAAENVEAKKIISECREYFIAGVMNRIRPTNEGYLHMICDTFADETPATDRIVAGIKADTANQMCVAFVKHKELAGLSDDDVVTVREATDAVLHCAEVISEGADK